MGEQQIKILIVIGELSPGGAEKQIFNLISNSKCSSIYFSIATRKSRSNVKFYQKFKRLGINIYNIGETETNKWSILKSIIKIIKKGGYNIVQSYLSGDNITCTLASVGTKARHVAGYRGDYGNPAFKRNLLQVVKDYCSWKLSDCIISNNNVGISYLRNLPLMKKKNIFIIFNGVNIPKVSILSPHDELVVGSLGNLWLYKNHEVLIRAWLKLRQKVKMIIAGDGPMRLHYANLLRQEEIEPDKILLGTIHNINTFFNSIDIFVYPSLREGSPNSLLEAMSYGKLCIVSDIPEHRETLGKSPNECYFIPGEWRDLYNKITYWINNWDNAHDVGKKNRQRIISEFSIDKLVADHIDIYRWLIKHD